MNAHSPLLSYEPVTYSDWSYVMTPSDFIDGCFTVTDPTGHVTGTGENKLGIRVTVPLNVPICVGCDGVIHDHVCDDCGLVFTDSPKLQQDPIGPCAPTGEAVAANLSTPFTELKSETRTQWL